MFDEILTDRIYEAAAVPELWPELLGELSRAVGGDGGILFTADHRQMKWTTSPDIRDTFEEFIRDGWAAINERPKRLAASNYTGFVRDQDFFTDEELESDPVYQFLRKRGIGWGTGALVNIPSGDSIIFSFERAFTKGPVPVEIVQAFDRLRPHLSRGALLSARLGLARAGAATQTLQALGLPGAVLRANGSLLNANQLFEDLMPVLAQDFRARLKLLDPAADRLLVEALKATSANSGSVVSSIPVAATKDHLPMIIHVLPICGVAHDIFRQATFLIVITPVDRVAVPSAKVLQGLFDLTPAEARVARAFGQAQTMEIFAKTTGVSLETVRSQLKSVLAKTGLSRQQELVHLLAGTALPFNERSE